MTCYLVELGFIRTFKNQTRYGYQGEYAEDETGEDGIKANSFQLRLYNPRLGRWMSPDPYGQYHSPYLAMGNTPINGVDPDGGFFGESTDVTDNGDGTFTVVGAHNDGDKNVYVVNSSGERTGQIIAQTQDPWTFMKTNDSDGSFYGHLDVTFNLSNLTVSGSVNLDGTEHSILNADGEALIKWGKGLFENSKRRDNTDNMYNRARALKRLSANGEALDFKVSLGVDKFTALQMGSTNEGLPIINTLRGVSNIMFGSNLRYCNRILGFDNVWYRISMSEVGEYNQTQNKGNGYNAGYPFYGEHTYSGTNIQRGFWNY